MCKAHKLGHKSGVMVSNRQGSETVVHDGDENGKVTQKGDNALASWDRLNFCNRDYCNQPCKHDWGDRPRIDLSCTVRSGNTHVLNFLELNEAPAPSYVCIDDVTTTFVSQLVHQEGQCKENSTPASEARAVVTDASFIEIMIEFFQGRIKTLEDGGDAAMQLLPKRRVQAPKEVLKFQEEVDDEEEEEGDTLKGRRH